MKAKKRKPGRPRSDNKGCVIGVYVKPEVDAAVRKIAEDEDRTISSIVDEALKPIVDRAMREYEKDMKRKKKIDAAIDGGNGK